MNTDKLVYALRQVFTAEQEEHEARGRNDGYEWGYHGFRWTEATRKAHEEFGLALEEAIDARVQRCIERSLSQKE